MAIFTLLLLERYPERFTGEQKDRINTWEAKLCEKSQEVQARADSSQETALVRLQQVFAEHAHRIVQLEKETLREVVMSNQARSHEAWKHAQNFFLRQFDLLTVEQRDLLEDWEVVLCDLSPLDADAFRLRMESCFDRSRWFLMQHAETIKQRGAESLQGVLRSRQFKDDPTAVFIVLLLERYSERLTEEQTECISQWEAELCQISPEAQQQATRSRAQAFVRLQLSGAICR